MKNKAKTGKVLQYSKKLSTFVCVAWAVFRVIVVAATIIRPEVAEAMVKLVGGVDSVMMVNLGFYCGNSVSEKAILAWMDTRKDDDKDAEDDEDTEDENTEEDDSHG